MNDKFSLVLEGHDAIRQEFKDSHRELEEKINLNSSLIKFGFETLDAKVEGVRTELKEGYVMIFKHPIVKPARMPFSAINIMG